MKLSDLTPDPNNANKGTERGNKVLEDSLQRYGLGRSILLDKHGTIIAGNKTAEVAGQVGIENVTIVETTGNEVVAVMRTDLDLSKDAEARELALADNRVGELSLDYDLDVLGEQLSRLDMSAFWTNTEVERLFASNLEIDQGELPPVNAPVSDVRMVQLFFNPEEQEEFLELVDAFEGNTVTDKTMEMARASRA
jgi:hypothetical protein|tara:strand:+ start:209 stop:793 length:585 start_codon:yes stop_codon:yes gene_type:complete